MRFDTPFTFEGAAVRVVTREGEPWFVAKDAAEILGYSNASQAVSQHCKGVANQYPLQTAGGLQHVRIIAEPDLLRLIIGSRLPAAEKFERWVFEEVLPAIRKTGGYQVGQPETRKAGGFGPIINVPRARGSCRIGELIRDYVHRSARASQGQKSRKTRPPQDRIDSKIGSKHGEPAEIRA